MKEMLAGAAIMAGGLVAGGYAYHLSENPSFSRFIAALILAVVLIVSGVVLYADGRSS